MRYHNYGNNCSSVLHSCSVDLLEAYLFLAKTKSGSPQQSQKNDSDMGKMIISSQDLFYRQGKNT